MLPLIQAMSFEEIVVLYTLLSFEGIVGLPIVDQFNKGGNCKLQGGLFIFIGKFSMGIFNIGGNCKLQFPEMKGVCKTTLTSNEICSCNSTPSLTLQLPLKQSPFCDALPK